VKAPKWRRQLRPRPLPAAASGEMQLRGPSMTSGICVVYGLHDSRLPSYLCLSNIHSCRCRYCKVDVAETLSIAVPLDPIDVPNITFRFCPGGKVTELLDAIFSTLAAFFGCNLLNLGSFFGCNLLNLRSQLANLHQPSNNPRCDLHVNHRVDPVPKQHASLPFPQQLCLPVNLVPNHLNIHQYRPAQRL